MSESERTYRHPHRRGETEKDAAPGAVCGRNAVRELVRSGRAIDKIFVLRGKREGSVLAIVAQARETKSRFSMQIRQSSILFRAGSDHQGIVALAAGPRNIRTCPVFLRLPPSAEKRRLSLLRTESRIRTISARLSDARSAPEFHGSGPCRAEEARDLRPLCRKHRRERLSICLLPESFEYLRRTCR